MEVNFLLPSIKRLLCADVSGREYDVAAGDVGGGVGRPGRRAHLPGRLGGGRGRHAAVRQMFHVRAGLHALRVGPFLLEGRAATGDVVGDARVALPLFEVSGALDRVRTAPLAALAQVRHPTVDVDRLPPLVSVDELVAAVVVYSVGASSDLLPLGHPHNLLRQRLPYRFRGRGRTSQFARRSHLSGVVAVRRFVRFFGEMSPGHVVRYNLTRLVDVLSVLPSQLYVIPPLGYFTDIFLDDLSLLDRFQLTQQRGMFDPERYLRCFAQLHLKVNRYIGQIYLIRNGLHRLTALFRKLDSYVQQ